MTLSSYFAILLISMTILIDSPSETLYPIIPVRDGIVFPKTENVLVFGRQKSVLTIQDVMKKDKKIVLVMQKNSSVDEPTKDDF